MARSQAPGTRQRLEISVAAEGGRKRSSVYTRPITTGTSDHDQLIGRDRFRFHVRRCSFGDELLGIFAPQQPVDNVNVLDAFVVA